MGLASRPSPREVAAKKVAKVYDIESAKLEPYTPDAFAHALKEFLAKHPAKLVLMPHTYQVRDFVPKLATALKTTAISDVIGCKYEGGKLLFTRQMFQGKFVADVSFAGSGPCFVTFQNGSFRADKAEAGAAPAPVETVNVDVPDGVVRNRPQEVFKEAKQAVDLTQAEIIVSVGRGIKEQKNIELAKQLADCARRRTRGVASDLRQRLAAHGPADRIVRPDGGAQALSGAGNFRSDSAHCRHERRAQHCGDQ